ncbi:MAG TPA: hypothetical protein VJ505_04120 [Holophagaceae bacterium]|nr:hypothetical protein [Holophagaceae bacterium]
MNRLRAFGRDHSTAIFMGAWLVLTAGTVVLALGAGALPEFVPNVLTTGNRTFNQMMAVVMVSISLIIPLTANLYTPTLVRPYVTHPMVAGGLAVIFSSHLLTMAIQVLPREHPLMTPAMYLYLGLYITVLLGALPFLYGISRFLRPTFFMPMLTRKGLRGLQILGRHPNDARASAELFEAIDVVTNIALTGMARGDRQLVLLALASLHTLLQEIQGQTGPWRAERPRFVPGLAEEGQAFLTREQVWPEAYVLAQTLKVMEVATKRQHEILSEVGGQLVETATLASAMGRDQVVELHVMTFNALLREAVEEDDLRRFQNLCYYYRLLIEGFHRDPERMHDTARHLLHYGRLAARRGLNFSMETILYDFGELVLSLGPVDEAQAVELVQAWAGPLWLESIAPESPTRKAGWRSLIRTYWEAKAQGFEELANAIYWRFLTDDAIHRDQLVQVLDENRELHYEFNDRLMRFAHLGDKAETLAREFETAW